MSWADFEYLSEHQESAHPLHAPLDYSVRVSERVLHLERAHFFLGSVDSDYHCPLLVTMREEATKNWRQRSASGWKHIAEKKEKFAEKGQERRKSERKGKGKGKEQYRASDHTPTKGQGKAPKPWNQPGQRRSVFEEPEDDSWGPWTASSHGKGSWSSWAGSSWSGR